jgi:hypothetical protein
VDFIQVRCLRSRSAPYDWLIDDGILEKPSTRTFFLWETDFRSECEYEELVRQFGAPARVVVVSETSQLLVYDYDLVRRM